MIARVAYGVLFVAFLPTALLLWARQLEGQIDLPRVLQPFVGGCLAAAGLGLMIAAWFSLWRFAGGLPMNAFPPNAFTRRGIYSWLDDPNYLGFVAIVLGVSVAVGSAAGLWIVTPFSAAACAALVLGYERHDLARRFGGDRPRARLALPARGGAAPGYGERFAVLIYVLGTWLILYEAVGHLPVVGATSAWLAFERAVPVWQWTELFYASVYVVVILAPFAAKSRDSLRRFAALGIVGTGVGMLSYLLVPMVAPPKPFVATHWLGELLLLERADGLNGRAAFPSFHVFWACTATALWRERGGWLRGWMPVWLALAISSCWTTGMHAIADLAAGLVLYFAARYAPTLWRAALSVSETIANSWREWRFGPVRIINHGIYAGVGAGVTFVLALWLCGPGQVWRLAAMAVCSLGGAALVGQVMVGGSLLRRPFGYFGSVLGVGLAAIAMAAVGLEIWALSAAVAAAAPFGQGLGRCRCLVQGCCHGAPAAAGIVYRRRHSRVVYLSKLGGRPLYPTPLYSMLANLIIGMLLVRMWTIGAPAGLIVGGYLILSGLARFVEESYRGEVQTQILFGLRVYQLFAALSVVAGMIVSSVPSPAVQGFYEIPIEAIGIAALVGLLHLVAMGVDFPESNRPLARLTDS